MEWQWITDDNWINELKAPNLSLMAPKTTTRHFFQSRFRSSHFTLRAKACFYGLTRKWPTWRPWQSQTETPSSIHPNHESTKKASATLGLFELFTRSIEVGGKNIVFLHQATECETCKVWPARRFPTHRLSHPQFQSVNVNALQGSVLETRSIRVSVTSLISLTVILFDRLTMTPLKKIAERRSLRCQDSSRHPWMDSPITGAASSWSKEKFESMTGHDLYLLITNHMT